MAWNSFQNKTFQTENIAFGIQKLDSKFLRAGAGQFSIPVPFPLLENRGLTGKGPEFYLRTKKNGIPMKSRKFRKNIFLRKYLTRGYLKTDFYGLNVRKKKKYAKRNTFVVNRKK